MSNSIDRQAAIDAILEDLDFDSVKELRAYVSKNRQDDYFYGGVLHAINAVQDLSPEQPVARDTNVLNNDTISRQAAIDELYKMLHDCFWADDEELDAVIITLNELPSAQPERTGKWIKHPEQRNIFGGKTIECSECQTKYVVQYIEDERYCRNCGARMEP